VEVGATLTTLTGESQITTDISQEIRLPDCVVKLRGPTVLIQSDVTGNNNLNVAGKVINRLTTSVWTYAKARFPLPELTARVNGPS